MNMLPRSFLFVRHGETDWNREGRLQGFTDIPLNETGRLQARNAIGLLRDQPIDRIVASPLMRARETAEIINDVLQKPLSFCDGLRERHFGILEGKVPAEMEQIKADLKAQNLPLEESGYPCPPDAETYETFRDRVFVSMHRALAQSENEQVLFVCHGGVYRVLRRSLLNDIHHSPNVKPFVFQRDSNTWRVLGIGDAA